MNRRELLGNGFKLGLISFLGVGTLFTSGCNVFGDLEAWIPVGLNAFSAIVSILIGAGVINPAGGGSIATLVGTIHSAFDQLEADVQAYRLIQPPPAGALDKIKASLSIIVVNFQAFLTSINVTDSKLLALVVGFGQIILGTIAGFETRFPMGPGNTKLVGTTLRMSSLQAPIVPKERSLRTFKHDWNDLAGKGGHPEAKLHESLLENIRLPF